MSFKYSTTQFSTSVEDSNESLSLALTMAGFMILYWFMIFGLDKLIAFIKSKRAYYADFVSGKVKGSPSVRLAVSTSNLLVMNFPLRNFYYEGEDEFYFYSTKGDHNPVFENCVSRETILECYKSVAGLLKDATTLSIETVERDSGRLIAKYFSQDQIVRKEKNSDFGKLNQLKRESVRYDQSSWFDGEKTISDNGELIKLALDVVKHYGILLNHVSKITSDTSNKSDKKYLSRIALYCKFIDFLTGLVNSLTSEILNVSSIVKKFRSKNFTQHTRVWDDDEFDVITHRMIDEWVISEE